MRRRTWGTGQVIAAVIILVGLFALGDYVYIKYLDGLTWNDIVQGRFLPSKHQPPPPLPVDASTKDAVEKDEPAAEKKPARKKKPSRPRKKKKPAQPLGGEP